jgi:hypothetical protein
MGEAPNFFAWQKLSDKGTLMVTPQEHTQGGHCEINHTLKAVLI